MFVGAVESGNSRLLPDFSRAANPSFPVRICSGAESSENYPHSPQPAGILAPLLRSPVMKVLLVSINFFPMLVDRSFPWFMPLTFHKQNKSSRHRL
jgi:hypothetical protein